MREAMQDTWLAELWRVSAPGALLVMTIHGRTALDYAEQTPDMYRELEVRISSQGLSVSGSNTQLDSAADHEGEYVNVFHDLDYVRKRWGLYFEIVEILPGYIFTHDLVVMRKRTGINSFVRRLRAWFSS